MGKNIDICHCNFCEKATKVDVLFEYIVPREESLDYDLLNDVYCLVKCKDCKAVFKIGRASCRERVFTGV